MDNRQLLDDHEPLTLNGGNLMRQMAFRIKEHDVAALGAQMTYYIILSVFPFFMLLSNIQARCFVSAYSVFQYQFLDQLIKSVGLTLLY